MWVDWEFTIQSTYQPVSSTEGEAQKRDSNILHCKLKCPWLGSQLKEWDFLEVFVYGNFYYNKI